MRSSSIGEDYSRALSVARRLRGPEVGDGSLIVSSSMAEAAGLTLYMAALHSGARVYHSTPTEAAIHIIPYRDDIERVVLFTMGVKDSRALSLAETGIIMELDVTVVGPEMHQAYESRLEDLGVERIVVPGRAPLLSMVIASLYWAPKLMGARDERYRRELEELDSALEWAESRYSSLISEASKVGYTSVYYTPSTRPGAFYYKAVKAGANALPIEESLNAMDNGIVFLSSVEESFYRDLLLACKVRGVDLKVFNLNTDPVMSTVYSVILSALVTGSIK